MRDFRRITEYRTAIGADGASYSMPSPVTADYMVVVVSNGDGWDHVSVSLRRRTPNWREMEFVKRLFFEDHETAMQLHVPATDHINCHQPTAAAVSTGRRKTASSWGTKPQCASAWYTDRYEKLK
jgi:hypothetical protein